MDAPEPTEEAFDEAARRAGLTLAPEDRTVEGIAAAWDRISDRAGDAPMQSGVEQAMQAMILLQKSHFDLIVLTPLAVDSTQIEVLTVGAAPPQGDLSPQARAFFDKNHAFSLRTLDEDFAIAEQIQRGLHTGANTHFRFARFEDALSHWRAQLDALIG